MRKTKFFRGSFTVEAAAIMGTVLLVIFFVLFLCAYVHGRSYLTAGSYERAVTGHIQEKPWLFGVTDIDVSTTVEDEKNTVVMSGMCKAFFGGFKEEIWSQAVVKKQKPVAFIRKLQAAGEVAEKWK